MRSWPVLQL